MKTLRFSLFFFPLLFAFASSSWSDDYSIDVPPVNQAKRNWDS